MSKYKRFFPVKGVRCPYCELPFAVGEWNPKVKFVCEDCQLLALAGSIK